MENKLKPCPFCGEKVRIKRWFRAEHDVMYQVACENERCPIQPMTAYHKIKGVMEDEWNRRVVDADADEKG